MLSQALLAVLLAACVFLFYLGIRRIVRSFTRSASCGCGESAEDCQCGREKQGVKAEKACCCHQDEAAAADDKLPPCCRKERQA